MSEEIAKIIQNEIKCRNCGAFVTFEPGTNHLVCDYCSTANEITFDENEEIEEIDYEAFVNDVFEQEDKTKNVYVQCDSCGAHTTLPDNITAAECAFCSTSLIVEHGTTSEIIRPKAILPFVIKNEQGLAMFKQWIGALWFAPNDLKRARKEDKLVGVYIPYWTYDSSTHSLYKGMRGDEYVEYVQRTVVVNGRKVRQTVPVTHVQWSNVSGKVALNFDDILILASTSLPKMYVEALEPFDLNNLVPFNEMYLSGFRTERYQRNVKEGLVEAKQKMDVHVRNATRRDIGGDHQRISYLNTTHYNITFKHILLPIWISAYRYKGKVYRFVINGRTGSIQGERPYSSIKIMLFTLLILLLIALLAFALNGGFEQGYYINYQSY